MLRHEKQTPLTVTMLVQEGSWCPGLGEGSWWLGLDGGHDKGSGDAEDC